MSRPRLRGLLRRLRVALNRDRELRRVQEARRFEDRQERHRNGIFERPRN